ncbi:hypothetical protein WN51_07961 [Melipona quadrifasciata]|uniref:Uncharacterized protein n=1 Tax=Melipona quadrifasciata TaxID=166423 RepID=A0A0M8ZP63_9HYME|nr:hypothetical protein WN51_07961 [Melipona quadrifasciata]
MNSKIPLYIPFLCNVTVDIFLKISESIHRLRPGNIGIIASMGDSLKVGVGITAVQKYLMLPNILKEFNPKLICYIHGDSISIDPNFISFMIRCNQPFPADEVSNEDTIADRPRSNVAERHLQGSRSRKDDCTIKARNRRFSAGHQSTKPAYPSSIVYVITRENQLVKTAVTKVFILCCISSYFLEDKLPPKQPITLDLILTLRLNKKDNPLMVSAQ